MLTHLRSDGNRLVHRSGAFPAVLSVDIDLPGTPRWLLGVRPRRLPQDMPPVLHVTAENFTLFYRVGSDQSFLSNSVPLYQTGARVYVSRDGGLVLHNGRRAIINTDSLPDG